MSLIRPADLDIMTSRQKIWTVTHTRNRIRDGYGEEERHAAWKISDNDNNRHSISYSKASLLRFIM